MEKPLRFRWCPRCGQGFLICRSCDRGHRYCGESCSRAARREGQRKARRRHRRSEEGRLDHRDRERERRRRHREAARRVGDQGYEAALVECTLLLPDVGPHEGGATGRQEEPDDERYKARCRFCGLPGRFVETGEGRFRPRTGRGLRLRQ